LGITDRKNTILDKYDNKKQIMKLMSDVYYDWTNGSLILKTTSGINVYPRSNQNGCATPTPQYTANTDDDRPTSSTSIISVGFCAWKVEFKNFLIIYFGNGKKTVIMILYKATNDVIYTILNVVRFATNGTLDDGTSTSAITTANPLEREHSNSYGGLHRDNFLNNPLSDYYRWASYWNGLIDISGSDWRTRNDVMLKTQIVPPVCPRCPSCPSSGVCTTCGGNGGSGTQKSEGGSLVETSDSEGGVTDLLRDAGSGTKDLLEDAGSGAKELVEDAASGVKDVAYDTAGGVKDVAYDVVGGTKDVAYDVAGGVQDIASDIAGGITDVFDGNPTEIQPIDLSGDPRYGNLPITGSGRGFGIQTNVSNTQGSDFMTYFGSLPPKGESNYIPVTADFSAFRR
jgi:hypothetical protein